MIWYLLTFVLAFASITYELLLGQMLSAFLGNTVLRYSVTIGLYLLSMGIGALYVKNRSKNGALVTLQWIELLLAGLGGFSLIILFLVDGIHLPSIVLSFIAHLLIIIIGVLSGAEIPLLIELKSIETKDSEGKVLGVDYLGAFLGTIAFAFYFYPVIGLTATAFSVALANALMGLLLATKQSLVPSHLRTRFTWLSIGQLVMAIGLTYCLIHASQLEQSLIDFYIS
ncbi:MAG: hypothetical protein KDD53_03570 [Bdellovibrionales bacterium]|nr:hypothetical protein [Bdellovibrionales bacterium]